MLEVVLHTVHFELTLDAVARAADADTLRVAALDHEASDDTVEDNAVIELVLYEWNEIINGIGSYLGVKLGLDDIAVFHFDGHDRIAH